MIGEYEGPWNWADKNYISYYQMKPPYDNVYIGSDPRDGMTPEFANSFDAIVNVSCTPSAVFEPSKCGQAMYWYPVNECGKWNLGYLYWLKKVMDHHYNKDHKIYLHCHAGAYRSPSAAILWLQSREHSPKEALDLAHHRGSKSSLYYFWEKQDNIPKTKDTIFELMREKPSWSFASIILHEKHWKLALWNQELAGKPLMVRKILRHYFWFYYETKWYIKEKLDHFKYFFQHKGYIKEKYGKTIYKRKYFWRMPKNAEKERNI